MLGGTTEVNPGTATSDTCLLKSSTDLGTVTEPLCGTGTTGDGANGIAVGVCGKCSMEADAAKDGDGTTQGTCTVSTQRCTSTGACMCVTGSATSPQAATSSNTVGTCGSDASTADTVCMTTGLCKCQKCTSDACTAPSDVYTAISDIDGDGDGKSQGTCKASTHVCTSDGTCKCAKDSTKAGDGDGTTQGTCIVGHKCCADGDCRTTC